MRGGASQYLSGGSLEEDEEGDSFGQGGAELSPHAWLSSTRGFAALARYFRTRAVLLHTSDMPRFAPRDCFRGVPEVETVRLLQSLTALEDSQIFDIMDLFDPMQKGGVCLHEFFLLMSALAVSSIRDILEFLYQRGPAVHRLVAELPASTHWQALCTIALLLNLPEDDLRRHCRSLGLTPQRPVSYKEFEEVLFLATATRAGGGGGVSGLFQPGSPDPARARPAVPPCCRIF